MKLAPGIAVDIVAADAAGKYCLKLTFSDRHVATVDFGPFLRTSLNPGTRRFLNENRFKDFSLAHGNLVWGDYEMCFPMEDLYEGKIGYEEPTERVLAVAEKSTAYSTEKKMRSK